MLEIWQKRELGQQFPDINALNKEYSFWKDVHQVTSDTLARRQGQGTPLGAQLAHGAGLVKGGVLGAEAMKALTNAVRSPAWGTVSSVLKDRLADAIGKGARGPAEFYINKIGANIPEQVAAEDATLIRRARQCSRPNTHPRQLSRSGLRSNSTTASASATGSSAQSGC